MDSTYLSGLFGIGGIAVGAVIAHLREKTNNTFRLHEEFSTEHMLRCRSTADHILENNIGKKLNELYESMPVNHTDSIWAVIGFYEKLHVAINHNRVNKQIVPGLFGEVFVYWYLQYLKHSIEGNDWDSVKKLAELYEWFSMNTHHKDFTRWIGRIDPRKLPKQHHKEALRS